MRHPQTQIEPTGAAPPPGHSHCTNCGAQLQGPYCHVCGQSTRHILKHLPALTEDALDVVFNIDNRILHTLPALYARPGFLAREYFVGRRVRYISPFRLMFFLSVLAFLLIQFNLTLDHGLFAHTRMGLDSRIGHESTPAAAAPAASVATPLKTRGHTPTKAGVKHARASMSPPMPMPMTHDPTDGGDARDTDTVFTSHAPSSLQIAWLPDFANEDINAGIDRARANVRAMKSSDTKVRDGAVRRFLTHVLSVLPQTLVVLIPLFALILKLTYIFKRRLYIEHLMVALYSHAFIFMSLLLWALTGLAKYVLPAWADVPMGWIQTAIWIWLPLYLLLMQKRIYMQGWFLTVMKYCFVGICYSVLLSFALAGAALVSLAT